MLEVGLGIKNFVKTQFNLRVNKWKIMDRIKELSCPAIVFDGEEEIVFVPKKVPKEQVSKRIKKTKIKKPLFEEDEEDEDIEYKKIPIIIIEDEDEDIKEKFSWFSETSK